MCGASHPSQGVKLRLCAWVCRPICLCIHWWALAAQRLMLPLSTLRVPAVTPSTSPRVAHLLWIRNIQRENGLSPDCPARSLQILPESSFNTVQPETCAVGDRPAQSQHQLTPSRPELASCPALAQGGCCSPDALVQHSDGHGVACLLELHSTH